MLTDNWCFCFFLHALSFWSFLCTLAHTSGFYRSTSLVRNSYFVIESETMTILLYITKEFHFSNINQFLLLWLLYLIMIINSSYYDYYTLRLFIPVIILINSVISTIQYFDCSYTLSKNKYLDIHEIADFWGPDIRHNIQR